MSAKQIELVQTTPTGEEQAKKPKEAKRIRLDYNATLNHTALKEQEGHILSNFSELVNKVIMIDGTPYNKAKYKNSNGKTVNYKLTSGRRDDFLRMIKEYAIIEFSGIKCHVRAVFDQEAREEIKNAELQKRVDKIKNS